MKTKYSLYSLMLLLGLQACTPADDMIVDFSEFEIAKVELGADHRQLIADGVSTLTLNPMLYQAYTYRTDEGKDSLTYGKIPADRIAEGTVQYFLEDGTPLKDGKYRTTDLSKSEVGFYFTANNLKSNIFKVAIREPFADDAYEEITYPVVFHVIQDKEKVDLGQGIGSDIIMNYFDNICNVFSRTASVSPNGADPKIRFRLAEYDPEGKKMAEKGINYHPMSYDEVWDISLANILTNPEICWDYKRYLNIWLIDMLSGVKAPKYILNTADLNQLQGLTLTPIDLSEMNSLSYDSREIGLILNAEDFAIEDVAFATEMGKFFGLLSTNGEDYCDDTFTYKTYVEPWNTELNASNSRLKISSDGLIFYSVNIMDGSSYKNTISMDQVKRIRMIAENCPFRWAWKSQWAFTGKMD